jgi:hypothetical protein
MPDDEMLEMNSDEGEEELDDDDTEEDDLQDFEVPEESL